MEDLKIIGEKNIFFIPNVNFSVETGICELEGESYLENTFQFYAPLLKWLEDYMVHVNKPITFNFGLSYFNTSSSRSILDILNTLKQYEQQGGSVTVNWRIRDWDQDMKQDVEDFSIDANLPIHTQTY
ncbi:DUF1987 domain-containing protein [Ohtaekwangia koreensis]|uniref:SiaC family regulatory phosphoprotein domain-containing protein n=1 Tax=Ohtaekwangia koreensis TaxID=688867 RepID=A0A1T5KIU9_9BACT|nr:DUF1987 domain-containing protein [Ohtaekwangia koreensis]SKC63647.1 protein of unknown function [Ohtaekwangia koreensis]